MSAVTLVSCNEDGVTDDTDTSTADTTADAEDTTPAETEEIEYIAEEGLPEPVFMRFGDFDTIVAHNVKFPDFDGATEGNYMQDKDLMALELKYAAHSSFPDYRAMLAFSKKELVTKEHKYIRITYMTPDICAGKITVTNNGTSGVITVVGNTSVSQGEWVTSNAVDISTDGMLERLINGIHLTFGYESTLDSSEFYIKEIGFFASINQAYDYYDDKPSVDAVIYDEMTFGAGGNSAFAVGSNYGVYTVDDAAGTLNVTYADSTNHSGVFYMSKIKFGSANQLSLENCYVRMLYSAEMPTKDGGMARIQNDKTGDQGYLVYKLQDTNGEYVLSDVGMLSTDTMQRFCAAGSYSSLMHNSLHFTTTVNDCVFRVKALYFFPTKESAEAFEVKEGGHEMQINGNDITKYQIVVAKEAPESLLSSANYLKNYIKKLTGFELPVVTDKDAESDYEILIGKSNRENSTARLNELAKDGDSLLGRYIIDVRDNDLIISSTIPVNTHTGVETFVKSFLYEGLSVIPDTLNITEKCIVSGRSTTISEYGKWEPVVNVASPEVFTETFDADNGYFQEENNAQNWSYSDGLYSVKAEEYALTYIHVYEKNATLSASWEYTDAKDNADAGLMLRYTADEAYVKAGYDFEAGAWYIEDREGEDFFLNRIAEKEAAISPDTRYDLSLTVDGDTAKLTVNGETVLETEGLVQLTPGRAAFYAEGVSVSLDTADLVLLSGQGTIMKDIVHTKLPDDTYREGGSVFEMNDGSLLYTHHSGTTFKSLDNGHTWERREQWTDTYGYVNILRLNNGDWLKIATKGGYKISQTSSDDGQTWVDGGNICKTPFRGDSSIAAGAGNMNDKIMQSGTTDRIFYCQNYETTTSYFSENNDGVQRKVFCEFYYSDDNGATWTKSETDSWELVGNEKQTHFGECKILECADGTLRMYNSWNNYECIIYSESTDYGVTWGPIQKMEDFICARSSMQFVRDPYAENDTTYYMVWVYGDPESASSAMARSRLSLARSTDGKNWEFLGDIWRWESTYRNGTGGSLLNHIVDPFVKVTEDYVIIGTGLSEKLGVGGDNSYHGAQRQHIWTVPKASLTGTAELPPV